MQEQPSQNLNKTAFEIFFLNMIENKFWTAGICSKIDENERC